MTGGYADEGLRIDPVTGGTNDPREDKDTPFNWPRDHCPKCGRADCPVDCDESALYCPSCKRTYTEAD